MVRNSDAGCQIKSDECLNQIKSRELNCIDALKLLNIDDKEANEKFGFLMDAFKYGAPPHGGMAFGFDRLIMLLAGSRQIRDVIAFPKTTSATSLMDNSPSNVDTNQLDELGLSLKDK